jgi:hypothetical protein
VNDLSLKLMGAKSVTICNIQEPKKLRSGVLEDNQQEGTKY